MPGTDILCLLHRKCYAKVQHGSELETACALTSLRSNKEKTSSYNRRWVAASSLKGGKEVPGVRERKTTVTPDSFRPQCGSQFQLARLIDVACYFKGHRKESDCDNTHLVPEDIG